MTESEKNEEIPDKYSNLVPVLLLNRSYKDLQKFNLCEISKVSTNGIKFILIDEREGNHLCGLKLQASFRNSRIYFDILKDRYIKANLYFPCLSSRDDQNCVLFCCRSKIYFGTNEFTIIGLYHSETGGIPLFLRKDNNERKIFEFDNDFSETDYEEYNKYYEETFNSMDYVNDPSSLNPEEQKEANYLFEKMERNQIKFFLKLTDDVRKSCASFITKKYELTDRKKWTFTEPIEISVFQNNKDVVISRVELIRKIVEKDYKSSFKVYTQSSFSFRPKKIKKRRKMKKENNNNNRKNFLSIFNAKKMNKKHLKKKQQSSPKFVSTKSDVFLTCGGLIISLFDEKNKKREEREYNCETNNSFIVHQLNRMNSKINRFEDGNKRKHRMMKNNMKIKEDSLEETNEENEGEGRIFNDDVSDDDSRINRLEEIARGLERKGLEIDERERKVEEREFLVEKRMENMENMLGRLTVLLESKDWENIYKKK